MSEMATYTAFCSRPDSPRGQYDEEIDVVLPLRTRETAVRKAVQVILDRDYEVALKIRRVVRQGPGFF